MLDEVEARTGTKHNLMIVKDISLKSPPTFLECRKNYTNYTKSPVKPATAKHTEHTKNSRDDPTSNTKAT